MSTSNKQTTENTYKGYCPECHHGMMIQTPVKMAAKMGDVFFINDNTQHYQCNFCGICIATDEAMQLMLFSSNAIDHQSTQLEETIQGSVQLQQQITS